MATPTVEYIVRAGIADWHDLQAAYTYDRRAKVYGFSVQYAASLSWEELAKAGNFPHPMICYVERVAPESALWPLGYALCLVPSPGRGYHHELTLALVRDDTLLQDLPDNAAQALSQVFRQHLVPRP